MRFFGLERLGIRIVGDVPADCPVCISPPFPWNWSIATRRRRGTCACDILQHDADLEKFRGPKPLRCGRRSGIRSIGNGKHCLRSFAGICDQWSGFTHGQNDASGGRTQVAGLVAAGTIALVLIFFTGPLRFVPIAALGAVLVKAGFSLIDLKALKVIYRIERREFALSILATLGVVAIGAIQAILFVVILALVRFVRLVARPKIELLGKVEGMPGYHALDRHPEAKTIPGLLVLRFNAPIVFFNAPYFKRGVLEAIQAAPILPKWIVLDMIPITMVDATGLQTAQELVDELQARGITLVAAGRKAQWGEWADSRSFVEETRKVKVYPTLNAAVRACLGTTSVAT